MFRYEGVRPEVEDSFVHFTTSVQCCCASSNGLLTQFQLTSLKFYEAAVSRRM